MSAESTTTPPAQVQTLNVGPFDIVVNGRTTKFGEKLTRIRDGVQTCYIGVIEDPATLTLADYIQLAGGEDAVKDILIANQNKSEQAITKFVKTDLPDGAEFPLDDFIKAITTGRAVGKTIGEINEEIADLNKQMFNMSAVPGVELSSILAIVQKIGLLTAAKEAKSRKRQTDDKE